MILAFPRPRSGALRAAGALVLAALAAWLLPLSGCMGGTTSEGGNPGITLQFTRDGKPAKYSGFIQIVAKDSNPEFFRLPAQDGSTSPGVIIGGAPGISLLLVSNASSITFDWDDLARSIYTHAELPLAKASAAAGGLPDFNIILIGKDSLAGWLQGVHPQTEGPYRVQGGDSGYSFPVSLSKELYYSGKVDTTGPAGRPLALFVPGTPYFAAVHGDRFRFEGMPAGRLPLRWLSADGWVHAIADSLGPIPGAVYYPTIPHPLKAGPRLDSLKLPPAVPTLDAPTATPAGQFAFTDSVAVTLTAQPGAAIYYTLDGSAPTEGSTLYKGPLMLRSSAILKSIAWLKDWNKSPVSVNSYVLVPPPPKAQPTGGNFKDTLAVTLSTSVAGATIRYTLDGSQPTATSPAYSGPVLLTASAVVKAVTLLPGLGLSQVTENAYVRVIDSSLSIPFASPAATTFKDTLKVNLATPTVRAIILYTLDGSQPTATSPVYGGGPIVLTATTTIKAVAKLDALYSPTMITVYTLAADSALAAPAATPAACKFLDTLRVTLAASEPGATIHYTLDGSDPSATSILYSGPILLTQTSTLKAITMKAGRPASAIRTEAYQLSPP